MHVGKLGFGTFFDSPNLPAVHVIMILFDLIRSTMSVISAQAVAKQARTVAGSRLLQFEQFHRCSSVIVELTLYPACADTSVCTDPLRKNNIVEHLVAAQH